MATGSAMHADLPLAGVPRPQGPVARPCAGISLRGRLIGGLLATTLLVTSVGLAHRWNDFSEAQTGALDRTLEEIGRQMLLSLPDRLEQTEPSTVRQAVPLPGGRPEALSYQVWLKPDRLLMRSPGAPEGVMLRADAKDGHVDTGEGDARRRVFVITSDDGRVQVQVGKSYAALRAEVARWASRGAWAAALLLLSLAAVVWIVVRWSLRPVQAIHADLMQRSVDDTRPLPADGLPAEIMPLVEGFNGALSRLHAGMQLERRFLADAAHELRTPLASLRVQADLAMQARSDEARQEAMVRLRDGIDRCTRLSAQMLDMARLEQTGGRPEPQPVDLARLVGIVLQDVEHTAAARGQRLSLALAPSGLRGHTDELGILVRNLVDNALRHGRAGGEVRVQCAPGHDERGPHVMFRVDDDGPGVPSDDRLRIFDRFHRVVGTAGSGCGIGLSLVKRVAELHGADLAAGPGLDGRGLGVSLRFPVRPSAERAPPARA